MWKGAGPPRNMHNPVGLETVPTGGNGFYEGLFQSITAVSPPLIHITSGTGKGLVHLGTSRTWLD